MMRSTRYARLGSGVKSRRASIERLIDAIGWRWNAGLSLLLDAAVRDEEAA
jgi:hypothetical protein